MAEQAHRQRLDYVVALIVSGIALSLLLGVGMMVVASIGASISYFTLYTFVTFGLSILLAYALVYVAEIELLGRVLST